MTESASSLPPSKPSVRERVGTEGAFEVGRSYLADRKASFLRWIAHRHASPSLSELYREADVQSQDPDPILTRLIGPGPTPGDGTIEEFGEVVAGLSTRQPGGLPYPPVAAISRAESQLLYLLVRRLRPEVVVETGVANGYSTTVLLSGLERNGTGRLLSVDLRPDVGQLVPDSLRARWELKLLSRRHAARDLASAVGALPAIDLFVHDSDHSYAWQMREYRLAWPRLTPNGVLASDDIDWSYAFLDFARERGRRPMVLVTPLKVFGILPRAEVGVP